MNKPLVMDGQTTQITEVTLVGQELLVLDGHMVLQQNEKMNGGRSTTISNTVVFALLVQQGHKKTHQMDIPHSKISKFH